MTWKPGDPVRAGRVFSYVLTYDTGFAPNPFHGFLTLACCKPQIRRTANVGDLVVGLSTRSERVIYAAQISEAITFEEYWNDPQYETKRPSNAKALVHRTGDNIYEPVGGSFRQLKSFHSNDDGTEDAEKKAEDLAGRRVLVCERFTYWGSDGPDLRPELQFLAAGRGHRCRFTREQVEAVSAWFASFPGGVLGAPTSWKAGDMSWREQ